jgi:hypothetical protein
MVYIPFPRQDHNNDDDLAAWRLKTPKQKGDWTALKSFLAKHSRLIPNIHSTPKCWYSELPQGDSFATDVEHFRPKNQASPLTFKQITVLKKKTNFNLRQDNTGGAYSWLEFEYRNYRLVTAITNRGGAKHVYFPIVETTARLAQGRFAWSDAEYPYFLDPSNKHDTTLLLVKPNGEIIPRSPKTEVTDADINNLPHSWNSDGFNFMRAEVTIQLYRLNERVFQEGRKNIYDEANELLKRLQDCLPDDNDRFKRLKNGFIQDLTKMTLPSAPFALAARCALQAYLPPNHLREDVQDALEYIVRQILVKIETEVNKLVVSWENQ